MGADRQPLAAKHIKKFRVVAADEEQPNPVNWKIATPHVNTRQPVTLTFNEALDHAMLKRVFQVRDPAGEAIDGKTTVSDRETVWAEVNSGPTNNFPAKVVTGFELQSNATL